MASLNASSFSNLVSLLCCCCSTLCCCWLNDVWEVVVDDFILYVAGVSIRGQSFCFNNNNSPQKKTRYNCTSSYCILKQFSPSLHSNPKCNFVVSIMSFTIKNTGNFRYHTSNKFQQLNTLKMFSFLFQIKTYFFSWKYISNYD